MTIDSEVKQYIDLHQKILDKHDEEIDKLKEVQTKMLVSQAEMSVKLSNIEIGQNNIQTSLKDNDIKNEKLINKLIDSINENNKQDNEIIKTNQNKLWELTFKVLVIVSLLIGAGNTLKDVVK